MQPAASFGPLALKAVRKKMIDGGLSRKLINQRVGRIRRLFKWGVSEELVPASVHHGLLAVEGLKAGRIEAKERLRVLPVADADIEATIPHVNRHVAGTIQFQRYTGAKPGKPVR